LGSLLYSEVMSIEIEGAQNIKSIKWEFPKKVVPVRKMYLKRSPITEEEGRGGRRHHPDKWWKEQAMSGEETLSKRLLVSRSSPGNNEKIGEGNRKNGRNSTEKKKENDIMSFYGHRLRGRDVGRGTGTVRSWRGTQKKS